MQINFVEPWVAVDGERVSVEAELQRELSPSNSLSALSLRAIGRRIDCDDVLFEVRDENSDFKLVLVHLTWSSMVESGPWPITKLFADVEAFVTQMALDAQDYN